MRKNRGYISLLLGVLVILATLSVGFFSQPKSTQNVGGGSGTITPLGSSSPLTTKGDLYTYSTVNARLPVGTNGYVLSANSGTTTGLEWITAPSGGVTSVTASLPISSSGGTTPDISITIANTSTAGAISSTDWNTFNNKVSSQWVTTGSNIYYSTGNVGIGTDATSPTELLFVRKDQDNSTNAHFKNLSTGTSAQTQLGVFSDTGGAFFQVLGSNYSYQNSFYGGSSALQSYNRLIFTTDSNVANGGTHSIDFMTGGYDSTTQKRMTIASTGQVAIGNTATNSKFNVYSATGAIQRLETGTSTLDVDFITTVGSGSMGINSDALYLQSLDSLSNGIYLWPNTTASRSLHLLANGHIRHEYSGSTYMDTEVTSGGSANFALVSGGFYFNRFLQSDEGLYLDTGNIALSPTGTGGGSSLTLQTSANGRSIEFNTKIAGVSAMRAGIYTTGFGIGTTAPNAALDVLSTTEQLRLSYDVSNYFSTTVGSAGDTTFSLTGTTPSFTFSNDLKLGTVGSGLYIKEGTNATMGTATLSSGTVTVNTTKVTANSRIFLTINGGTLTNVGAVYVSARTAGTSFTISSINILDASDVAWVIVEPS